LSRYHSYFNKAVSFLELYQGKQPFALFLKEQFALNKQMGSTDRKWVRHYCYCYFRMGKAMSEASVGDKLLAGIWLVSKVNDPLLALLRSEWNEHVECSTDEKLKVLGVKVENVFPFEKQLSERLRKDHWVFSLFSQPDLFIRLRPGKEQKVLARIHEIGCAYRQLTDSAIAFSAATALQNLQGLNRDYVVQDFSSQQIATLLTPLVTMNSAKPLSVWDCCAASGGKSILSFDTLQCIDLLASDVRRAMIPQLKNRLQDAGLKEVKTAVIDLEQPIPTTLLQSMDLIIADVPCTGSGTWGRTPEQLYFFEEDQIENYSQRQQTILRNVLPALKNGGYLLYCTCSVFTKENEAIVEWLVQHEKLKLIHSSLFTGTENKADTLYGALLRFS
jgi:16S rRNA (cytosine967-C5)-methyltransferase